MQHCSDGKQRNAFFCCAVNKIKEPSTGNHTNARICHMQIYAYISFMR